MSHIPEDNRLTTQIIKLDPTPTAICHLTHPAASSPLTSVAWAPSCGRSYHLIATGSRDGTVRIWRLDPPERDEKREGWTAESVGDWGKGGARVAMVDVSAAISPNLIILPYPSCHASDLSFIWSCAETNGQWNATGTTLTSSDDEGIIRVYKRKHLFRKSSVFLTPSGSVWTIEQGRADLQQRMPSRGNC